MTQAIPREYRRRSLRAVPKKVDKFSTLHVIKNYHARVKSQNKAQNNKATVLKQFYNSNRIGVMIKT